MNNLIYTPSSIEFKGELIRGYTRDSQYINEDYTKEFDNSTIFYDVIQFHDKIILVGPPLRNFMEVINSSKIIIDGELINDDDKYFSDEDLTTRSFIKLKNADKKNKFKIVFSDGNIQSVKINQSVAAEYENSNVLMTLSKNNEIPWIINWIKYHVINFEIDTLLFYDNGSDIYTINSLLERIKSEVPNLENIIICEFDFKYGANIQQDKLDIKFDSMFLQNSLLNHCKYFLTVDNNILIWNDIDELIYGKNKVLKSELNKSPVLLIESKWVGTFLKKEKKDFIHNDFIYKKNEHIPSGSKWVFRPKGISPDSYRLNIHSISNIENKKISKRKLQILHYEGINNSWKRNREITKDSSLLEKRFFWKAILLKWKN